MLPLSGTPQLILYSDLKRSVIVFIGRSVPEADGSRGHCLFPSEGRAAFVQERGCTEGQLAVSGDLLQLQGCPAGEADMMLGDIRGTQQAPFSRVMFHFGRCLQHAGPSLVSKQPNADLCMALTGSECCKKGLTAKHTHPPTFRLCGQNPALTPSTRVSHPLAGTRKMDRNGFF